MTKTTQRCGFPIGRNKKCKRKIAVQDNKGDSSNVEYCHMHRNKEMPPLCTICLSHVINESSRMTTSCDHIFHKDCLIDYLRGLPEPKCPNCRTIIQNTYSLSSFHLGIPLLHLVQHTNENLMGHNGELRKQRDELICSGILRWTQNMNQLGQQLVAVHLENIPFEEIIDQIKVQYPQCIKVQEINLVLLFPHLRLSGNSSGDSSNSDSEGQENFSEYRIDWP